MPLDESFACVGTIYGHPILRYVSSIEEER